MGGFVALIAATVVGWNEGWLDAIVGPPLIVRAALIATSAVVALWLLGQAARLIAEAGALRATERDLPRMIRGVRLVFLAIAAVAAAIAWALSHPLPLVVALIIAAVDVVETSFLLLVVTYRRRDGL